MDGSAPRRLRVGLLGPWHPILGRQSFDCERIEDPEAALGSYDLLLITFADEFPPSWIGTLSRALRAGKRVRHVVEYLEKASGRVALEHFSRDHLEEQRLIEFRTRKRAVDRLLALAAAPLILPILALASLAILMTMGRPILFVQDRIGMGGRVFRMIKLRTMHDHNVGEVAVAVATAKGDARVTPLGWWLRRLHVDELPQFWNVWIGDMSVVGPRPEQPRLAEVYSHQLPAFLYRQIVRPGITGWAQVRAPYAADLAETQVKLAYDLFYLKHFSFWLDARILARTVLTLIRGGGAR